MLPSVAFVLFLACLWFALSRKRPHSRSDAHKHLPLPPGPTPLPVVGNFFDIPSKLPWVEYAKWAEKYGDIVYMRIFDQPIIVLNSLGPVVDLFEKRAPNYSDRLLTEMVTLMGWDWNMVVLGYGPLWRRHRRAFHQYFNRMAVNTYEPQLREAARKLLRRLYHEPKAFAHHLEYTFAENILSLVYGIQVTEKEDPHIAAAERALAASAAGFNLGAWWVDFMPFLKYVPSWMLGAGFKRMAVGCRADAAAMKYDTWKSMRVSAVQTDSPYTPVAVKLSERYSHLDGEAYAEEERIAQNVAGMAYAGGTDTTVSTLQSFLQAMVLYPNVLKRAQDELARVVGPSRLPDFSDRPSLTYINAICKECMRWQTIVPLGFGHRAAANDEYGGFFIPKGTVVWQNTWAILHDPKRYPNPQTFSPERFIKDDKLNPDVLDPTVVAFGGGRRVEMCRICPGRFFSDLSLFINVACILHVFDITPALDAQGNPIKTQPHMESTALSHPSPFPCTITPRSNIAESLILG
ncbi:CyP450 monooxygenase [Obba rivulosa]|uniref:CyP450 monooxygenase n=1 Tax=Obba rivulosa TaxID=1052685 RepID=A0A8E2DIU1_9APHY|nr:CyP450 monooxygenase [Obba rivulosa]